ncbi:MAG TPA: D-glycero-beta-D-manno-heptose 1-phosphate adenylyltransferase [Saprospiraceae bacterium]|nr:D-glycero-beta-D-manno-heptose 1-phosphate adenylyltransferase [Saprospiraceae bacterium]
MISTKLYFELGNLMDWLSLQKKEGKTLVFTNGCFDLLHKGHVQYLEEAKMQGDILIVGINSDTSVKRLKGEERPIQNLDNRMNVLAALESVDAVIPFEEDNPLNLIKNILPDVLVKGGDWKVEQILGSDIVLNNGGSVKSLQFVENQSTSSIVEKIKKI